MRNAIETAVLIASCALLGGCGDADREDNAITAAEANAEIVEVDTLPPDESSATPSDELAAGAAEPVGNSGY